MKKFYIFAIAIACTATMMAQKTFHTAKQPVMVPAVQKNSSQLISTANGSDNSIITSQPDGIEKYYLRKGISAYPDNYSSLEAVKTSGYMKVVFAADGSVYFRDPVGEFQSGHWIKGTMNGNKISFPEGQNIWLDEENNLHAKVGMMYWDADIENWIYKNVTEISYTISTDSSEIKLDNTNAENILAMYWEDSKAFTYYGDYNSTYSLIDKPETLTPPADLKTMPYKLNAKVFEDEPIINTPAKIGIVDNEVYIQGLSPMHPNCWVKGMVDEQGSLIIPKGQFLEERTEGIPVYVKGLDKSNEEMVDIVYTYDKTNDTYTQKTRWIFVCPTPGNRISYFQCYTQSTISGENKIPHGDLNNDGVIDVKDITELVKAILAGKSNVMYDIDTNSVVDVSDVTALINMILK